MTKKEEFLKKWSAVIFEPEPYAGPRYAMLDDLNALLSEGGKREAALVAAAQTLYDNLQRVWDPEDTFSGNDLTGDEVDLLHALKPYQKKGATT